MRESQIKKSEVVTMKMIPCSGCGKIINGEEAFCPYCGTSTKGDAVPQDTQQHTSAQQPYTAPIGTPPVSPSYVPPVYPQQPAAPSYEFSGKTGKGMGWIVFMRVILWIIFAGIVITGLVYGIKMFDYRDGELYGILCILSSVLTAFIVVAGGMIALNNATNLRSIAMNTAKTVELLQEIKRK